MPVVYYGVLTGDRIEWQGRSKPPDGPVVVEVVPPPPTPTPTPEDEERRRRLAEVLESLAASGGINAEEWEREREELENYCPWERALQWRSPTPT